MYTLYIYNKTMIEVKKITGLFLGAQCICIITIVLEILFLTYIMLNFMSIYRTVEKLPITNLNKNVLPIS